MIESRVMLVEDDLAILEELISILKREIKEFRAYSNAQDALKDFDTREFGGIEANPHYETCMKAVELVKANKIDFLLAVGGGSVLDATKFIAAAALFENGDPWDFLKKRLSELGLSQNGSIYRSKTYCLRVCQKGPVAVVHPDNVWYHSCTP